MHENLVVRLKIISTLSTIALLGHVANALSKGKPEWTDKPPKSDDQFRYYVGRASNSTNEKTGFDEAMQNAINQAIQENYGFKIQMESDTYQSVESATTTTRIKELSRQVEIHDFEFIDSFTKYAPDSRVNVWVLYRYKLTAIAEEKSRLGSIKNEEEKIDFSEGGNTQDSTKGVLEVVTNPAGAVVSVDGALLNFMNTPLRVYGQISAGKHTVKIEHPQYAPIEEDIVMLPGNVVRLNKVLLKASAKIKVVTNKQGANVVINGQPAGLSPTQEMIVPAGEPIWIEVSHPETLSLKEQVEVPRNETKTINLTLTFKPAFISLDSEPRGSPVQVDSHYLGTTPTGKVQVEPGGRLIIFAKDGYQPYKTFLTLHGGDKLVVPTVKLIPLSEKEYQLAKFPWLIGISLGIGSTPIQSKSMTVFSLGVGFEKRFYGVLGGEFELTYLYGAGGASVANFNTSTATTISENGLSGFETSLSLPLHLSIFYIAPQVGYLDATYTNAEPILNGYSIQNGTSITSYSVSMPFYGGKIGYESLVDNRSILFIEIDGRQYGANNKLVGGANFFLKVGGFWKF